MFRLLIPSLLAICLFIQPVFAEKPKIAVFELQAINMSGDVAISLSGIIWETILMSEEYELLIQANIIGSDASPLKTAEILGVDKVITGQVSRAGKTCSLKLSLFEKKHGATTKEVTRNCEENELPKQIRLAVFELLEIKPPQPQISPTENMALVRGGCYQMGCGSWTSDCFDHEYPVHEVCVDDFHLDKHEVTQTEYKKVMGENPANFKDCEDCPVEQVSWFKAQEYCQISGKRLPTEAEWEYAARSGGKEEKYAGTAKSPHAIAWYKSNSDEMTRLVGKKKPNGLGLYDMSGNVWEWCNDHYDFNYYRNSPQDNPQGPAAGKYRVLRGGCWSCKENTTRSATRYWTDPTFELNNVGFRCAKSK